MDAAVYADFHQGDCLSVQFPKSVVLRQILQVAKGSITQALSRGVRQKRTAFKSRIGWRIHSASEKTDSVRMYLHTLRPVEAERLANFSIPRNGNQVVAATFSMRSYLLRAAALSLVSRCPISHEQLPYFS